MRRPFYFVLGVALALSMGVAAETLIMTSRAPQAGASVCPSGVCISTLALTSARATGWIPVEGYSKLTFGGALVDANDTVTAVTVNCEWSNSPSTATDAGYDICAAVSMSTAATSTMVCPHTWSFANAYADHFAFTIENLNAGYVQCKFTGTGTPAAADTLYVEVMRRTP